MHTSTDVINILLILSSSIFSVQGELLIVGGVTVPHINDLPYLVSIHGKDGSRCGGSIISRNYVLTAAHCLRTDIDYIRSGSAQYNSGGSTHKVTRKIINDQGGDLGILKVNPSFHFNKERKSIRLVDGSFKVPVGAQVVVAGWGKTEEYSKYPGTLQEVILPIISLDKCKEKYENIPIRQPGVGNICAAPEKGGKDSCAGDSGGPMIYEDRQAGIVSYGVGCARKEFPGVYVNVAYYRDWIREKTGV